MTMFPELDSRAEQILAAIIQEYLLTGDAVSSRTITSRYGVDLSSATVRNVMGRLEELGLLQKLHTSAGRLPTDQGLRFFVDSFLKVRQLSEIEKEAWTKHYAFSTRELDTALQKAGKVLSALSNQTVILVTPRSDLDVLAHIEFVRLPDQGLLAVLVNKSGRVYNRILDKIPTLSPEELERIHQYLNYRMEGRTLSEIRTLVAAELSSERVNYDTLVKRALTLQAQALPHEQSQVIVQGQANLLGHALQEHEFTDPDRLKALFRALEEKNTMLQLLDLVESAKGIQVFIGAESPILELIDYSLVTTSYGISDQALGVLGVIGPTRMDYPRIISLVDFTAQLLSKILEEQ